jgi:hypothetical protein
MTHILYKFRYPCFTRLTSGKITCIFTVQYTVQVQHLIWRNSIYKKAEHITRVYKLQLLLYRPEQACKGFRGVEAPTICRQSRHMQVARLSALRSGRFYLSGDTPGTHLFWRMRRPQSRSAGGRNKSVKNHNDPVGNRARNLPACTSAPPATVPPRTPHHICVLYITFTIKWKFSLHLRRQLPLNL